MIKENELRFGNYVIIKNYNSKYWNKIGIIEGFSRNAEYISLDINKYSAFYLKDIEPITLTEEILIKCGFEKYNFTEYENGYIIEHKEPSKCVYIRTSVMPNISGFYAVFNRCECNKNEIQYIKKIEYLHELQNMYQLLTNEELTIQL